MDTIFGLGAGSLAQLKNGNARVLFITRAVRMAAYGSCGVVLALYLSVAGLSDERIGILLTGTLVGDAAISLAISLLADRLGRRHMLMFGCLLKVLGAAVFAYVSGPQFWLLLFGATVGVISPSGNEVGPFMALEQSMLTDQVDPATRTSLFAWYNLVGYVSTALGSLATGFLSTYLMQHYDFSEIDSYRIVFVQYGGLGVCLAGLTLFLTSSVEAASWQAAAEERRAAQQEAAEAKRAAKRVKDAERDGTTEPLLGDAAANGTTPAAADGQAEGEAAAPVTAKPAASTQASFFGLSPKSRGIVAKLSFLFSMDSFGGGLVTGSLIVYYFKVRFDVGNDYLGGLLFVANIIAGISSLAAGWVASKVGLINTMVVTHLPSNVLLMLVPVMPTLELATAMLFLRYSISQMDVAPRQSYVSGIVPAHERTATMGITNIVKSLGAALGPSVTGYLAANGMFDYAFYLAGGIKILYDLLLLWSFQSQRAEHETVGRSQA